MKKQKEYLKDVTVFVVSCGNNPNYADCMEALDNQTVEFKIDIIKNYNPIPRALQEYLNRCETTYYIGIDEDMILDKNAIEILYESIISSPKEIAMICYHLLDVHINVPILGIKIFKHEITKNYPYNLKCIACDVEQLDRLKKEGYDYTIFPEVIGKHSPKWTNELIFERYLNLIQKSKKYGWDWWLKNALKKLIEIYKNEPTEINFCALAGAIVALTNDNLLVGEKDYTQHRTEFIKIIHAFKGIL
jgi:hypothetical protein